MDTAGFWDAFYAGHADCGHEWYSEADIVATELIAIQRATAAGSGARWRSCIHIGCGTSLLGDAIDEHLLAAGARSVNVDFSATSIADQLRRNPAALCCLVDVTSDEDLDRAYALRDAHTASSSGAHAVLDKGTFDALLQQRAGQPAALRALVSLIRRLRRVALAGGSSGGVIAIVSIIDPDTRLPFLLDGIREAGLGAAECRRSRARPTSEASQPVPASAAADSGEALPKDGAIVASAITTLWLAAAGTAFSLHVAEVRAAPLEMPDQPCFWVYWLQLL